MRILKAFPTTRPPPPAQFAQDVTANKDRLYETFIWGFGEHSILVPKKAAPPHPGCHGFRVSTWSRMCLWTAGQREKWGIVSHHPCSWAGSHSFQGVAGPRASDDLFGLIPLAFRLVQNSPSFGVSLGLRLLGETLSPALCLSILPCLTPPGLTCCPLTLSSVPWNLVSVDRNSDLTSSFWTYISNSDGACSGPACLPST